MLLKKSFVFFTLFTFLFQFSISSKCIANSISQPNNYGNFSIPNLPGWNYNVEKSSGNFFVFENSNSMAVSIRKEPVFCETHTNFNKAVLKVIQSLPQKQEYMEQRKQAAPYPCFGQKFCHMIKVKSRATGLRKFVLLPLVDQNMYQIEIDAGQSNVPPPDALNFINQISLGGSGAVIAQTTHVPAQRQQQTALNKTYSTPNQPVEQVDDGLSAFKKNKSVAPPPPSSVQKTEPAQPQSSEAPSNSQPSRSTDSESVSAQSISFNIPDPKFNKGTVPEVKFSATDPCAPTGSGDDGLPWEASKTNKIELPDGVNAAIPPAIQDLKQLSDFTYNAAVSQAFEGMRIVYGVMPEQEAKKFEQAWTPLFDFPTQEIIDYLNKLNPLIAQFLAVRESYIRNITASQMILLDIAVAVEADDREVWEEAMEEASMFSSVFPPIEAAMKKLANSIEELGNPPNPMAAKCEANRRYKKSLNLTAEYPFEGEWLDENGKRFLMKVVHTYSDGKVLVYEFPISWLKTMEAKGFDINKIGLQQLEDENLSMAMIPGMFDLLGVFEELEPNLWVSRVMPFEEHIFIHRINNEKLTTTQYSPPSGMRDHSEMKVSNSNKVKISYDPPPVLPIDDEPTTWDEFLKIIPQDIWAGSKYKRYMNWRKTGNEAIAIALAGPQEEAKQQIAEQPKQENAVPEAPKPISNEEQLKRQEEDRQDAIAHHTEMVSLLRNNLSREIAERNEVVQSLVKSKSAKEAEEHKRRLKDLNLRIIGIQSNMQAEQDLVNSHKTGKLIHTRTAFDEYAKITFIKSMKENAARVDATKRIAERMRRQIKLLPYEQRAKARQLAQKVIDGKTLASGNVEKARKLASTFNEQIQGYAEYDFAMAKEAEIASQEHEFYAQMGIMAAGAMTMGFGSAALAEAYGANAAATIYGTKLIGAIYGGTTGCIAGGPKEGVQQAASYWSPIGGAIVDFYKGYEQAGESKNATTESKIWNGMKNAGFAFIVGKAFELGVKGISKVALVGFGKNSRLFKPIVQTPSQRAMDVRNAMRTTQKMEEAKTIVKTFESLEMKLARLKLDKVKNANQIAMLEGELGQLSASLNADYHAKWWFKYKSLPRFRRRFDTYVQQNYDDMMPGLINRLKQKGYNMDNIEFRQFRNSSSGGSSSMDLDLGPVSKNKRTEPDFFFQNNSKVSKEQFMNDAQLAMNDEYRQLFKIDAEMSDMNLVTSVHPEAFSTPDLLKKDVDFSKVSAKDLASVGKVVKVKMEGISKNKMLTNTAKMQAKCREATKEIDNMLLKKLDTDLSQATPGSFEHTQIQDQIKYWKNMRQKMHKVGMVETNPMEIINTNREIMKETGGKDVTGVINDLSRMFGS